jgi:hypothetical protein
VVFIRELVPSRLIAWIARTLYNEPYRRVPYRRDAADHVLRAGGREHRIAWTRSGALMTPSETSLEHFLKEHELGVGRARSGAPQMYRVAHPVWRIWPKTEVSLQVDFGRLYGEAWGFLGDRAPVSSIAAEGSAVEVFGAERAPRALPAESEARARRDP